MEGHLPAAAWEREYGGAARRRKSRDLQIRSSWGPGLHQGVVSTARGGVRRVIAQVSDHRGGRPHWVA